MNAIVKSPAKSLAISEEDAIRVLGNSLYPGARPESIRLVLSWCKATGRDPMKRPIHIVPMWVKDAISGQGGMRDVLMPGIGTYRTDAANSGAYAGKTEPEFGPDVTGTVGNVRMIYPKWCKVTVGRIVHGEVRKFTAMEFWLENYATAGRDKDDPNAMWRKRPYGMLAKCAEAQALRMAFPDETGNSTTAEEMEGKTFDGVTIEAAVEDEIPQRIMDAPPKKPSTRAWLEDLHATLSGCHTKEEIETISNTEQVQLALVKLNPDRLAELKAMLAEAYERVGAIVDDDDGSSAAEPDGDDDFRGEI